MTQFSYQLYSSRNYPPLSKTLSMVAHLGYTQVEGYGALYASLDDLEGLKSALAENDLAMSSGHVGLDMIEKEPGRVLRIARILGMKHVFAPHIGPDDRPTDADGWRAFGARLSKAGQPLRDAGVGFGWHNHDFEFKADAAGSYPIDAILEGGPDLELELDVAWVARAGEDPAKWVAKLADRIVAAHVKDIASPGENADEDGWADVGQGILDWRGLMTQLRDIDCDLFVAEHDNPGDDARFASRSIAFLNGL